MRRFRYMLILAIVLMTAALLGRQTAAQGDDESDSTTGSPAISGDGRFIAFGTGATDLVPGDTNDHIDIFVANRLTGDTERVSVASDGTQANGSSEYPAISDDGRLVAFLSSASNLVAGDTNDEADIFVHDRHTHQTTRVSISPEGTQADHDSGNVALSRKQSG